MEFHSVTDVKQYMATRRQTIAPSSAWWDELDWFSAVNYTTTSEYFGELRLLVQKMLDSGDFENERENLLCLMRFLGSCFG